MKINFIRIQNFRNVGFAEVELGNDSVWIFGNNAQGKTNLLEALGLLYAVRSFRTSDMSAMIRFGEKSAAILVGISHEKLGNCEVQISISDKRKVFIGNEEVKFSDFIGKFPALAMSSDDIEILRGSPDARRKDYDMFLSSIDSRYFDSLKRYHSALSHRNALLKNDNDASLFEPFEKEMAISAREIFQKRNEWFGKLGEIATSRYEILAKENGESANIKLKSSCDIPDSEAFKKILSDERAADMQRGHTRHGPHRDDFKILVGDKDAKVYASEGQQRSAVLSIKLAQFEILKNVIGVEPVMLCDDILGELDASRRAAFWSCIDSKAQVIATSTTPAPTDEMRNGWKIINVAHGEFKF